VVDPSAQSTGEGVETFRPGEGSQRAATRQATASTFAGEASALRGAIVNALEAGDLDAVARLLAELRRTSDL
jgi:hypothetical protein